MAGSSLPSLSGPPPAVPGPVASGEIMRKLTTKQRAVWKLRQEHPEWTFKKIGNILGIDPSSANRRYQAAIAIMGKETVVHGNVETKPDVLSQVLVDFSDPRLKPVAEMALEEGLSPTVVRSMITRLDSKYLKTVALVGEIKADTTLKNLNWVHNRMWMSINAMTEEELSDVSARDRAVIGGIAFDKAQLLQNRPTEIIRTQQESEKLSEVGAFLEREVRRRAEALNHEIVVEVDPETGKTTFTDPV